MTRRDYGSGSITSRGANRWMLRWYAAPDPVDGVRRRRAETFTGTKRDAMRRLNELATGEAPDTRVATLGDAIRMWRAQAGHAKTTAENYDRGVATIPEPFRTRQLSQVTAAGVRTVIEAVTVEHGIARARLVHAVISGALTYAWRQEWIKQNPARRVEPPAQRKRRATSPEPQEVAKLLAAVEQDAEAFAWLLLSSTMGGRPSEVLALHWSDIDLTTGRVDVHRALEPRFKIGDAEIEKATKTETDRTVTIGPVTIGALRRWRTAFLERAMAIGQPLPADPYVFAGDLIGSRPWRPDWASKRFSRLSRAVGVSCRLYDLRHYAATVLLADRVPAKVVADRLGHTRTQTTTDIYGHVLPASDLDAAQRSERWL